jgi:spore maturation protein CgeB
METLPAVISRSDVCIGVVGSTAKAGRVVANKVYQAMAMGRVVVTADSPAIREFFSDGRDVCLVPGGDPAALAEKIEFLFRHPEERRAIGSRAVAAVRPDLTSYVLANRFMGYCREILEG